MKIFLMIIVAVLLAGVLRAPVFLVCERPLKKAITEVENLTKSTL